MHTMSTWFWHKDFDIKTGYDNARHVLVIMIESEVQLDGGKKE
jgi:hypothetical protein